MSKDSTKSELMLAAISELKRVKTFFATMTSVKGIPIIRRGSLGSTIKDEEFTTNMLIFDLKNNRDWKVRAKTAKLLAKREVKGVPEALIEAMENDPDLEVRKTALDAFELITGFVSSDVFGFETAKIWWDKNKPEVDKKLKEPELNKE